MKRYVACLIDKNNAYGHPLEIYSYQSMEMINPEQRENECKDILDITSTKYKFGYIDDEINNEHRKSLSNISHVVTKVEWEDSKLMVYIMTIDTPSGKLLESLLENGMLFCLKYNWKMSGCSSIDVYSMTRQNCNPEYILTKISTKKGLE